MIRTGGDLISSFDSLALEMLQRTDMNKDALLSLHREAADLLYGQFWGSERGDQPAKLPEIDRRLSQRGWQIDGPPVIKLLVDHTGNVNLLRAPRRLVVTRSQEAKIPLIVKNEMTTYPTAWVQASWPVLALPKTWEFGVPPESVRAFLVPIPSALPSSKETTLLVTMRGRTFRMPVSIEARNSGKLRVSLEDGDGNSIAARCYLTGADSLAHWPQGNLRYMSPRGGEYYFYTDRGFEIQMPSGDATLVVTHGPEFLPYETRLSIAGGEVREVIVKLQRQRNMNASHWYSGDVHIHANLIGHDVTKPRDVLLAARAEDLNVANVLVSNSLGNWIHDAQNFRGHPDPVSTAAANYIVSYGEETTNFRLYGHMALIGLTQLVEPTYTGWPATPHESDFPANFSLASQARKLGSAVTYVHVGDTDPAGFGGRGYELPVDVALGQVDAVDVLVNSNVDELAGTALWYRLLNCGFKLAASAGTDASMNLIDTYIPGGARVYVHVDGNLSHSKWVEAFRRGRSFATNGPLLQLTVDGKEPGTEIHLSDTQANVLVKAQADSVLPMDRIEIITNSKVIASRQSTGAGRSTLAVEASLPLKESSWIAARVSGPPNRFVVNEPQLYAHTSPVYCYRGNQPIRSLADAAFFADWIPKLIKKVERHGVFRKPEHKEQVLTLFRKAQQVYTRMAR